MIVSKDALKSLRKLDREHQERVIKLLEDIKQDPRSKGKPLVGNLSGSWRYRVGKVRVVCVIDDRDQVVKVYRIAWRKDAYR